MEQTSEETKYAASRLDEAGVWLDALIDSAFDGVIANDQSKKVTVFNRRAEEIFGWKAEEIIGHTARRLYVDVAQAREVWEQVNGGETLDGWPADLKHRDGTHVPVLLSANLIRNRYGDPIGQAGYVRMTLQEGQLKALIKVSQAMARTTEPLHMLELVARAALQAFPMARGGAIHLYDPHTETLQLALHTSDLSPEAMKMLIFAN